MSTRLIEKHRQHVFGWLFVSLMLTLGVDPILRMFDFDVIEIFLAVNLLVIIFTLPRGNMFRLILSMLVIYVVLQVLLLSFEHRPLFALKDIVWIFSVAIAIFVTAANVLGRGEVNSERIFAALDLYLLIGLLFGVGYVLLDQALGGAFKTLSGKPLTLDEGIYFSFVTITTLGYGDIVPIAETARRMASFEAVCGQIYLTVLIARLVSLYGQMGKLQK